MIKITNYRKRLSLLLNLITNNTMYIVYLTAVSIKLSIIQQFILLVRTTGGHC